MPRKQRFTVEEEAEDAEVRRTAKGSKGQKEGSKGSKSKTAQEVAGPCGHLKSKSAAQAPGSQPKKQQVFSKAACELAFRTWEEQGMDDGAREAFFGRLDSDVEKVCKQLQKRRDLRAGLERMAQLQDSLRLAAHASLHLHITQSSTAKAGAKQTGLRRAHFCVNAATRLQRCAADVLADNASSPAELIKRLQMDVAEVAGWPAALSAAAGVAAVEGPRVLPTRGTTAAGRLRRLDAYMGCTIGASKGVVVDLGFGRVPVTTVEMAHMLWRRKADLRIVGVEADRSRAQAATENWEACAPETAPSLSRAAEGQRVWTSTTMQKPELSAQMRFAYGGFSLPLLVSEQSDVVAIRAMNVLRQYETMAEGADAHAALVKQLAPGGLLFEGTSDLHGDTMTVYIFEAGSRLPKGLLFACNRLAQSKSGSKEFSPEGFAEQLPQALYGRDVPGEDAHRFLECWRAACRTASVSAEAGPWKGNRGVRWHFQEAAKELSRQLPAELGAVPLRRNLFRRGWLLWENPAYGLTWKTKTAMRISDI